MNCLNEIEAKRMHEPLNDKRVIAEGPIIVGAGPSGLATAACLQEKGIPSLILERADCIASLWQYKTYDRLRLHIPKQFCQLPLMPFPPNYPTYPNKQQFVAYLEAYTKRFNLEPVFNNAVVNAAYDEECGLWRVETTEGEYVSHWLIVATGENAEEVVPNIEGLMDVFKGPVLHSSLYKSGEEFRNQNVLVVGCGNSGMEVCLDLCNYNAIPSLVVRDKVHVLPQEMIGRSTFGLSMSLLKWFPVLLVDKFLLLMSWFSVGDTSRLGLHRPDIGPLELKNLSGKTPVIDVGTLAKIKSGHIKVFPGIKRVTEDAAEFIDGRVEKFNAIILATGYKSNVSSWLNVRERDMLCEEWKGGKGLYAVGFTKKGLVGVSIDARRIADDISRSWKSPKPNA